MRLSGYPARSTAVTDDRMDVTLPQALACLLLAIGAVASVLPLVLLRRIERAERDASAEHALQTRRPFGSVDHPHVPLDDRPGVPLDQTPVHVLGPLE